MAVRNFLIGLWLFVYGLLVLTRTACQDPMETTSKMNQLFNTIVDLSFIRPHTDCIFTGLGILYIITAVEFMHGTCCGYALAFFASLFSALTFDNPLFMTPSRSLNNYTMAFCHILMIGVAMSLCCEAHKESEEKVEEKPKEKVKEKEEIQGKAVAELESTKKKKKEPNKEEGGKKKKK